VLNCPIVADSGRWSLVGGSDLGKSNGVSLLTLAKTRSCHSRRTEGHLECMSMSNWMPLYPGRLDCLDLQQTCIASARHQES
jgi:hypothetical protein